MVSTHSPNLREHVAFLAHEASIGINEERGLGLNYDQTRGNLCNLLTLAVLNRIERDDKMAIRRELHQDEHGNWHYLLAHQSPTHKPSETDLISDLNPWQYGGNGQGILHMPRKELMRMLEAKEAPPHFIALRSLGTIIKTHDTNINPFHNN